MPIIPLLKKTGPIANAPAAVLDTQRRPNVDNRNVQQAVGNLADSSKVKDIRAGDFTGPTEALGAVGRAIAQGGSVLGAYAIKLKEAETVIAVNEADTFMKQKLAEHGEWRGSNPDAGIWEKHLHSTLKTAQETALLKPGLSNEAKHRIFAAGEKLKADALADLTTQRGQYTFKRAASTYDGNALTDVAQGNYESARNRIKEKVETGYGFPHEIAHIESVIERAQKADAEEARQAEHLTKVNAFNSAQNLGVSIAANAGEKDALAALDRGEFGKLEPADSERIRNSIQATARDRAGEELNKLAEGIATGAIATEAAIDALSSPHLSPLLRQQAKTDLRQYDAAKAAKDREENGVKNAVELRQTVKAYDPAADPTRAKFFSLNREIRARVDEVNQGELTQTLFKKYGTTPPKVELRPEIQRNVSASLDVMFDPENGAIPWRRTETDDSTGKTKITEDSAARQQAINAQTVVEMGMSTWYRDHPEDAQNLPKVQEKLRSLLPEGTRASALGTLNQLMRPAAPPVAAEPPNLGAQGATGPQGAAFIPAPAASRITSYAYSNDSTPDSNSSAGIGAFVPDEEQAKIKAGEPSPYKLRDGDFAVSGDVEKNLRAAGIEPGDEVTVQLADGSTQTGRWMDRTADTWEGETVTGRFDFYRGGKSTKHPKEAAKVTGFRKAQPSAN